MLVIRKKIENIANLFREKKVVEILLVATFVVQFVMIAFFNIKLMENHMGYDSSWSYLKAALMWKEKTFFGGTWEDQTNMFLDSSMPLASLLFGITGNLFVSYGLSNVIVLICALLCMNSILELLGICNISAKYISFNLMVCPYLTNGFDIEDDLGYFSDMLSGPAFYSLRALLVLLIIREYLVIRNKGKIDILGIVALVLNLLAGISSGIFIIVIVLLPFVIFIIERVFLENEWKILWRLEAVYAYISVGFVLCGKVVSKYVLGIEAIDETRTWTPITLFFTNLGAPLQGLMKLLGVLPVESTDVSVLSKEGIYSLFPLGIFVVTIIAIIYAIHVLKTDYNAKNGGILFLLNIVAINYVVFALFNVQYGAAVFEERYLICLFMVIIILIAYYIEKMQCDLIFAKALIWLCLFCLIGMNYVSDKKYINTTNDVWQVDEIKQIVDGRNADLIYLWGDKLFFAGRNLRAYDLNHVYKNIDDEGLYHHWGDYLYYEDNSEYEGDTLLIVQNGSEVVPENIMQYYNLLEVLDGVSIYEAKNNPIDRVVGITGDESIDFPTTPGVQTQFGKFDGNSFVSDGSDGYVMWGPYSPTYKGEYNFEIDYSIISGNKAIFDIAIDDGAVQLDSAELDADHNTAMISNVLLEEGYLMEYRVVTPNGTKIRIDRIKITKN